MGKLNLLLALIIISFSTYCQNNNFKQEYMPVERESVVRQYDVQVITKLDKIFVAAIERHFEELKIKKLKNKNEFYVVLTLYYPAIPSLQVLESVYDSIYKKNDFTNLEAQYDNPKALLYDFTVVLINKHYLTRGFYNLYRDNIYLYESDAYNVWVSSMLDLTFETEGVRKTIEFSFNENVPRKYKKLCNLETNYRTWGPYVTQIKRKGLISPSWTSPSNDF